MNAQEHARADHIPYIKAVCRSLERRGVHADMAGDHRT
jgi:hypothetical protein